MKKKVIKLIWVMGNWMTDFVDDKEIKSLFGTTIIPTPWTDRVPIEVVIERLQQLNPDCIIE